MRKSFRLLALAAAVGLSFELGGMALAQSSSGQASNPQQRLNHSLKGTFSFPALNLSYEGVVGVGTLSFDGKGNVTGTMDLDLEGAVCLGNTLSGMYAVNSDRLTGTATLLLSSSACSSINNVSLPLSLSLVRNGNGVVTVINMAEMDSCGSGTLCRALLGLFGAVAQRSTM